MVAQKCGQPRLATVNVHEYAFLAIGCQLVLPPYAPTVHLRGRGGAGSGAGAVRALREDRHPIRDGAYDFQ